MHLIRMRVMHTLRNILGRPGLRSGADLRDPSSITVTFGHGREHLSSLRLTDDETEWRPLSEREQAVVLRLLEQPFEGRDDVLRQLQTVHVKDFPDRGLWFDAGKGYPPQVGIEAVVTAHTSDTDGMMIEVILMLKQGRLYALDVWKGDGSPIIRPPDPSDLRII
jgi:hypothetical protein